MPKRGGSRLLYGGVGTLLVAGVIVVIVLAALGYFNKKGGSSGSGGKISPIPYTPGSGPSPSPSPVNYYFTIKNIKLLDGICGNGKKYNPGVGFQIDHNIPLNEIHQALVTFNFMGAPGYGQTVNTIGPSGGAYEVLFDSTFPPPTGIDQGVSVIATTTSGATVTNTIVPWSMPSVSAISC